MLIVSIANAPSSFVYGLEEFTTLSTIEDTEIGLDMLVMSMI